MSYQTEERKLVRLYNSIFYPAFALLMGGIKILENTENPVLKTIGFTATGLGILGMSAMPIYAGYKGPKLNEQFPRQKESSLTKKIN